MAVIKKSLVSNSPSAKITKTKSQTTSAAAPVAPSKMTTTQVKKGGGMGTGDLMW